MNSLILRTTARFLLTLLLLFSIFLLLRGHNEPGGGFVGGLVAAGAFALYGLASNVDEARKALRVDTRSLIGAGLLLAFASGAIGLLAGKPYLTGLWWEIDLFGVTRVDLSTPLLFDIGVYLVVLGVALMILFTLAEE
jgi:multicomponent Na+:H+ antiporter subunit B